MPKFTLIVSTRPVPYREAEWDRWYDEVHLDEVLRLEGFTRAHRLAPVGHDVGVHAALAVYEIEAADEQEAVAAVERLKAAPLTTTNALDTSSVTFELYRNGASRVAGPEGDD